MKLTLPQMDILFEQLLYPGEPIHNIGAKIEIRGQLHFESLNRAYMNLIEQTDAYRTLLVKTIHNEFEAEIAEGNCPPLGYQDFSDNIQPDTAANEYMQQEFLKPFNLFGGNPLYTFTLVKVHDTLHYLFSVYHHIITDGWGTSLMFQRLVNSYNEILEQGKVISTYDFRYSSFQAEDQAYQKAEAFLHDRNYWVERFSSLPENLFTRLSNTVERKSSREELIIDRHTYERLQQLAHDYNATTFHLILAILFFYFGSRQQKNDISIGLPVLNRNKAVFRKTVGLFMGISPLRITIDFESTLQRLVSSIKTQLRADYRHQQFPLSRLLNELNVSAEQERLFNITLSYEKQDYTGSFTNTQTRVIPLSHQSERVALAVYIREFSNEQDVKIDFDYNTSYFTGAQAKQAAGHIKSCISRVLENPNIKLTELKYISAEEENWLLYTCNKSAAAYPQHKTVVDIFEEQANAFPEKIAVTDGETTFTYADLNTIASKMAASVNKVLPTGSAKMPVAVMLKRGAVMLPVLLAVLKSGRPFIPLDPEFPEERLRWIINDSCATVIITDNQTVAATAGTPALYLADLFSETDVLAQVNVMHSSADDTAYIIYTSGSTGNPKGVEIGHKSLTNFLISMRHSPGLYPDDVLFSITTCSFDISILEFFGPLITGATLYMAVPSVLANPSLLIQAIEASGATVMQATPSFYQMLFNAGWQGCKKLRILCGGDSLSELLAEKLIYSTAGLWNMYGPTETTIWSCCKRVTSPGHAGVIGKPVSNTQVYILDSFLRLLPAGAAGSIYIGGHGLAKGYYRNMELTTERFIKNPVTGLGLAYNTGDQGRWNEEGELEFLGRNDNQVKIRGYRIELGEIETILNQVEGVREAVVVAKKGTQHDAFLAAFIVAGENTVADTQIIATLKEKLPDYMIPYVIVRVEKIPLTPNQKKDRKLLAQTDITTAQESSGKYPETRMEKNLAACWQEALGHDGPIQAGSNFFSVGGHSLAAIKLINLIARKFSVEISFKTIFDYPTIESLASLLEKQEKSITGIRQASPLKKDYPATPAQQQIWLASQLQGRISAYNMVAVYAIEGEADVNRIKAVINNLIRQHEILRTVFFEKNGVVYQCIQPYSDAMFDVAEHYVEKEEVQAVIDTFAVKELPLETGLLLDVNLVHVKDSIPVLLFCAHHIILDGFALEIFIASFAAGYNSKQQENMQEYAEAGFQFKDYSEWLNARIEQHKDKSNAFWKQHLAGYQPKQTFFEYSPSQLVAASASYNFEISGNLLAALKTLAATSKNSLYSLLLAALNVLISRLNGLTDICIATINSGRYHPGLAHQLGMFAKTILLRTSINPDESFGMLSEKIQQQLFIIDDYQDVPADILRLAAFDIMLVYQGADLRFDEITALDGMKLRSLPVANRQSRIPLVFNFFESREKVSAVIDYNTGIYDYNAAKVFAENFLQILHDATVRQGALLSSLIAVQSQAVKPTVDFDFDFDF
jgi:amino acid adenylation domain-containing protein